MPVPATVVVLRNELQQASATLLQLEVAAALHSTSVMEAASEPGPEAAAGSAVAVGVTVVGLEAAAGFGANSGLEFVQAEVESLPVEAVAEGVVPPDCPAQNMAASTQPVVAVVGPVVPVVTEAVPGVQAAIGIALLHQRHFDLVDWPVGQDAAGHKQP